jgi:hypothetical protein
LRRWITGGRWGWGIAREVNGRVVREGLDSTGLPGPSLREFVAHDLNLHL